MLVAWVLKPHMYCEKERVSPVSSGSHLYSELQTWRGDTSRQVPEYEAAHLPLWHWKLFEKVKECK